MTILRVVQLSLVRWCKTSLPIHNSPLGSPNPFAYSSHERLKSTEPSSRFCITVQGPTHFAIMGRRELDGAIIYKPLSDEFISEQSLGSVLTMFSNCASTLSSSSISFTVECALPTDDELNPRTALFAFASVYKQKRVERKEKKKFNYNYDMTGFFLPFVYFFLFSVSLDVLLFLFHFMSEF